MDWIEQVAPTELNSTFNFILQTDSSYGALINITRHGLRVSDCSENPAAEGGGEEL